MCGHEGWGGSGAIELRVVSGVRDILGSNGSTKVAG